MKTHPRPSRSPAFVLLLALLASGSALAALTPTEWPQRQSLPVDARGLVSVALPAATFDAAQPGLVDLRLIDASGQEVAYLLDRDLAALGGEPARLLRPASFRVVPVDDTTQLIFATGTTDPLEAITLETSVPYFLKAAQVAVSADGTEWRSLGAAIPLFRQFGAEQLRLPLDGHPAAFVRVTLDDFRSRPVTFDGAKLVAAPTRTRPPEPVPFGAQITHRDEFAGETVLTVTLDGRQAPLAGLVFETKEPLFMRRVIIAIRELQGAVSGERVLGSGTIYRVALDGAPVRAQLEVPLDFSPPTRELLVHIPNGDSPPLGIDGVQARQHPVNLLFRASAAGTYTLLTGNPQVAAPRYDLAAFAGEMRTASASKVTPGAPEPMPNYRPRESLAGAPLPDVPLAGAPLDAQDWTGRKSVRIAKPGVQELELDPATLARAQPSFGDLRLLHDGNQIPYVLEQPALARSLSLGAVSTPDPKRPSVSVWQLHLPQAGLPLRRLVLTSATPLFQREFRLYEKLTGTDGRASQVSVASGPWSRTPEPGVPETRTFELSDPLRTDTVWIETDNGDNPAIALGTVQAVYPVVRLIFKVAETDGFTLAYGNLAANAPRYDLSLVAAKLLTASRNAAEISAGETSASGTGTKRYAGLSGGYVFWGALALVVVVLLGLVAKLFPKPPGVGGK